MADISIWEGSATWATGKTAFGFYDEDTDFQTDAPLLAKWCAQRLGYPLVDIELQDENFFTAFEEAVTEYGHQVYTFQIINTFQNLPNKCPRYNLSFQLNDSFELQNQSI